MPASTLDPVNGANPRSLLKTSWKKKVDQPLSDATKKALLSNIDFEPAGSYQSTVLDTVKTKYIILKSTEAIQASKPENIGADETLSLAKQELYNLYDVQRGWRQSDWSVGAGMVNVGNTCYLNSTLQALFHVPAFVNWLISDKQHMIECEKSGDPCIICAMCKTLQDSQQKNTNCIRPFLIYNKLKVVCRNFIPGRQEDAHEFLRYLVEAMEKAYLSRFNNHTEFDSRTKETTPLNQILGGYLRSAVKCLECDHVSTTFQHFQDLLLDIRKAKTLDEALEGYFSRENLDDESYHCESCQKKVPATKQFSLERVPMVLCIQLKRFSGSNHKITKHIQFRQCLELSRYAKPRPSVPLLYRLVALVTHMGPTVSCGHYTAIGQAPSGNFYQFDDSMVRPISHQAVSTTNAYIMFYELQNASVTQKVNSNGSNKIKITQSPKQERTKPQTVQIKGNTRSKPYGFELPPKLKKQSRTLVNINGNKRKVLNKGYKQKTKNYSSIKSNGPANKKEKSSKKSLKTRPPQSSMPKLSPVATKDVASNVSSSNIMTKLIPYDDESKSSNESNTSPAENNSRVSTKAALVEWKVSSTSNIPSLEENYNSRNNKTINEFLKMSYACRSGSIYTWYGTRPTLYKGIGNEKREDRKRSVADNSHQGRLKQIKTSSKENFKSNPDYNPIQEQHNAKNLAQNGNQSYRQFHNNGNRQNNKKHIYHKNYHRNNRQ